MQSGRSLEGVLNNLLKLYEKDFQSDPLKLRFSIPEKEMWRLFIDKRNQENGRGLKLREVLELNEDEIKTTIKEAAKNSNLLEYLESGDWGLDEKEAATYTIEALTDLDRAWLPYEQNERGYLKAMYNAFDNLFYQKNIDINFIKKLHKLATASVNLSVYTKFKSAKGEFRARNISGRFGLSSSTTTEEGLHEFLQRNDEHVRIVYMENKEIIFSVTKEELNLKIQTKQFYTYTSSTQTVLRDLYREIESKSLAPCVMKLINEKYDFRLSSLCEVLYWRGTLYQKINGLFKNFNMSMSELLTPIEKLKKIILFVQLLEQLHPFLDGNCRVFCMLFLNFLLMRFGFPYAILDNPNQFDMHSVDKLVLLVLDGMLNTLNLTVGVTVCNIKTDDVLNDLKKYPYLKNKIDYFSECVAIEESNRKKWRERNQKVSHSSIFKSQVFYTYPEETPVVIHSCCIL